MNRTLNIALLGKDFSWGGGAELLRNFANALLSLREERNLKIFLLLPVQDRIDTIQDVVGCFRKAAADIIIKKKLPSFRIKPLFDPHFLDYFQNIDGDIKIVFYNGVTGLRIALKRIEADVALPLLSSLGAEFPFPWIGYIPDFQHKYYPQYFQARECLDRDILFATTLRDAKAVIVNARSVKDDADRFFPYHENKIFNLPFCAFPVSGWMDENNNDLSANYKLPARFFMISNQFWVHKSHITAFEALAQLVRDPIAADVEIVCTGKMDDYRFPDHLNRIKIRVAELGLVDKILFLGHIPKLDQIRIMKRTIAVIQPTLFEGGPGGGSVYDAVSLGIPVLVSDIPVNQEIDASSVLFFKAGSVEDLAIKMKSTLVARAVKPTLQVLIAQGEKGKKQLGKSLLAAIEFVVASSQETK